MSEASDEEACCPSKRRDVARLRATTVRADHAVVGRSARSSAWGDSCASRWFAAATVCWP